MDLSGIGAIAAAVIAAGALGVTLLARRDSKSAARSAAESARAAADALALERAEVLRAVERHDVEWTKDADERSTVVIRNVGSSTARKVSAVITVNGARHEVDAGDVAPGAAFEYGASADAAKAVREYQSTAAEMRAAGYAFLGTVNFDVSARVTWLSDLGTPGVQVI